MENVVGPALELSSKELFTLDKYWLKMRVENSVSAIQHKGNRKKFIEILSPIQKQIVIKAKYM